MEIEKLYQIAELYLKYLSVFLSWPVMVVAVLLIFFCKFHAALDHLIRTLRIKSPTGYEIQSQQPSEIKDMDLPESITLTSEQQKELEQIYGELEEKYKITKKERDRLREQSAKEFGESVIWKFRYLDLFFVLSTKNMLGYLALGTVSRQAFDQTYSLIIPDYAQRDIRLRVLLENDMIREKDGLLEITPEGRLFLRFLGWSAPPPPSS